MRDQFTADGGIILDNALGYWVARVYLASRAAMYRRFRAHGVEITPEQWMVLVRLWEQEGVTQTHLAERTFRDVPTMSRILALMDRDGLIARRQDPTDRRARLVYLTARGRQLRKALSSEAMAMVDALRAGIPEDDLLTTRRTLQRLLANLEPEG
ncbi:MarR family winged helix-turn-helix transcriptional regulator [Sorangium sp. So ce887]|uniref:MarR family winged helix-turn-helix transcriptional regulator n=1 Tax=Sorangium sp. So ce887 TaxID=3133324 RepID=UPI003F61F86C